MSELKRIPDNFIELYPKMSFKGLMEYYKTSTTVIVRWTKEAGLKSKKIRRLKMALCHPNLRNRSLGYCHSCYNKIQQEKKKSKPPSVCHPNRPKYGRKEECRACYTNKLRLDNPELAIKNAEGSKKWRYKYPERAKASGKKKTEKEYFRKLEQQYDLTLEKYNKMLDKQKGCCALCGIYYENRKLNVDHDHETGKVRALLCSKCNNGLGLFNDNPELLEQAALYVKSHR